jgi:hypothetical protein
MNNIVKNQATAKIQAVAKYQVVAIYLINLLDISYS